MGGRNIGGLPPQPHPVLLRPPQEYLTTEDRIAHNRREIQLLVSDHREMTATHATLAQDLSLADQNLRDLTATARKVREERETEVKELYDKSLAVEAEVKGIEALTKEHAMVVAHIEKLSESKDELAAQLKGIDGELEKVKLNAGDLPHLKADLLTMRQELNKGRAAIEFEKKTWAANLEQYQAMEKHMNLMQSEIEKLRAELAHAEKRARAAAAAASNPSAGYSGDYGSPNMVLGGGPYSSSAAHYSMNQARNSADGAAPAVYRLSASEQERFDMHQAHVPKG